MKKRTSKFAIDLARTLEKERWKLFMNRSGTSLDDGMVNLVAERIDAWLRDQGWGVERVEKDG